MAGSNGKFKTITISEKIWERLQFGTNNANQELHNAWEEREKLQKFAKQITKIPETIQVYTCPHKERVERRERNG